MTTIRKIIFITILAATVMAVNGLQQEDQAKGGPYICSKSLFSYELGGEEWVTTSPEPNKWFFRQDTPFKYRFLAKIPIYLTYQVFAGFNNSPSDSLYYSYLIWSFLFLSTFLYAGGMLAEQFIATTAGIIPPSPIRIFHLATILLVGSPPILFAFKFPVHGSPNDFLGYTLISLSILALAKEKLRLFIFYTGLGIFCRETNLIVLLPLWAIRHINFKTKISISAGLLLLFVAYRLSWPGIYSPTGGSIHNLRYPLESILFLLLVFGPVWFLGIMGHKNMKNIQLPPRSLPVILRRTFYPATLSVLAIVISLARVREIRIEFILFFHFIPFASYYITDRWPEWTTSAGIRKSPLHAFISGALALSTYSLFLAGDMSEHPQRMNLLQSFFDGFGDGWAEIFTCYLFITLFMMIHDQMTAYWIRHGKKG